MLKNRKSLAAVALLAVLIAALALVWHFCGPAADTNSGSKKITVTVIHGDGSSKEFAVKTDAEFLRAALDTEKLVSGDDGEFGLFIKTVDGETVNDENEEWWCVTKGGEMLMTGVDDTPIADGDCYEITLKVGYDF